MFFFFIGIYIVYAQDKPEYLDTLEYRYPYEITVTARRLEVPIKYLPFPCSVTDKDMSQVMQRTLAIDEMLKLVPGVKVDNQANDERVHL